MTPAWREHALKIGVWIIIASEALLFAGLFALYASYRAEYPLEFHLAGARDLSTVGAFLLASGLVVTLGYLAVAVVRGRKVGPNPWRSWSFEWRTPSPPPAENFVVPPQWQVGPYDYDEELEA